MDSTIIPDEVWKFAGGSVRELHQDDLALLARVSRRDRSLAALFETELRRRSRAAKRQATRRSRYARVFV